MSMICKTLKRNSLLKQPIHQQNFCENTYVFPKILHFDLWPYFCFYSAGELEELVREVKGQLKKIAITSSNRKDKVFLDIDMDRQGFIGKENLQEMCLKQHLPADSQIIDRVSVEKRGGLEGWKVGGGGRYGRGMNLDSRVKV